ncbi:hypothetical protein [Celeribacter indicus]|uniref:Uncharacterized protein n=1 Tax=Celeribacter indicus TaxID=1208324 RepID=A0A0B5DUE2_9RHOB|nr:hypothetical protein [Celeribacter indicus]AJE47063.1 hypothetical protein P73_2348 [Celeribacter indicus]SDW91829.1 hypothetical protein SAMN05443573_10988 [Celeribacter indicus]
MTDTSKLRRPVRLRIGHGNRLEPETRQVTLLLLLLIGIFGATVAHDEFVAEAVQRGWLAAARAETAEVLFCAVLFACFAVVQTRLMACLKSARDAG